MPVAIWTRFFACLGLAFLAGQLSATDVIMNDGRILTGAVARIHELAVDPLKPGSADSSKPIVLIDDDLRRTYVCFYHVAKSEEGNGGEPSERISIKQQVCTGPAGRIGSLGEILATGKWDKFGRRIITMSTTKGRVDIVQGITEITPLWTRVEALQPAAGRGIGYIWDMRIATSSIPTEDLHAILNQTLRGSIDPKTPAGQKKAEDAQRTLARLFIAAKRFSEADREWKKLVAMTPQPQALEQTSRDIERLSIDVIIKELEQRSAVGQHQFARRMYAAFAEHKANSPDVAANVLQRVTDGIKKYDEQAKKIENTKQLIDKYLSLVEESGVRRDFEPLLKQIKAELSYNTIDRMASFLRLHDAEKLRPEQKLALAVSGWCRGANEASENVRFALTDIQVRDLIRKYLVVPTKPERTKILLELQSLAISPETVAQIADFMSPPFDAPREVRTESDIYGYQTLTVKISGVPDVNYLVQLPPEYDPYRRYPCIVTLHSSGTTPEQQIDWWAGPTMQKGEPNVGRLRIGQATRQGYIVIAPQWTVPQQSTYGATAIEHNTVLAALRDASRRFAIDTDRVYLSGHSLGANAAWDIALGHPDLWAGVIPIGPAFGLQSFATLYTENARGLPFYFIVGELDSNKLATNAAHWNRYFVSPQFDSTVVEYQGRGNEDFSDEIQRLFEWMKLKKRNFYPPHLNAVTMRTYDNFFNWLEVREFPDGLTAEPVNGERPKTATKKLTLESHIVVSPSGNAVTVKNSPAKLTVFLSPEMFDFKAGAFFVEYNNKRTRVDGLISVETMLEDIRTRGDRRHPFWVKFEP